MKRWTLRILLCLLLGAITTVAVAWGLAWQANHGGGGRAAYLEPWWRSTSPVACQNEYRSGAIDFGSTIGVELATLHGGATINQRMPFAALRTRAGFPRHAVEGSLWYQNGVLVAQNPSWGFQPWISAPRAFPLRPIWPGFTIDTLFYAAIWFGVCFGFASAKRAIRRKRGRCPRCGYDLRGQLAQGCPECGWRR